MLLTSWPRKRCFGLMGLPSGGCAQRSVLFVRDETGEVLHIQQGEGGEQGDPLFPILFCLAPWWQPRTDVEGEHLFAFLSTYTPHVRIQIASAKPTVHFERAGETQICPPGQQGIRVLRHHCPPPDFIRHFLGKRSGAHSLFECILAIQFRRTGLFEFGRFDLGQQGFFDSFVRFGPQKPMTKKNTNNTWRKTF